MGDDKNAIEPDDFGFAMVEAPEANTRLRSLSPDGLGMGVFRFWCGSRPDGVDLELTTVPWVTIYDDKVAQLHHMAACIRSAGIACAIVGRQLYISHSIETGQPVVAFEMALNHAGRAFPWHWCFTLWEPSPNAPRWLAPVARPMRVVTEEIPIPLPSEREPSWTEQTEPPQELASPERTLPTVPVLTSEPVPPPASTTAPTISGDGLRALSVGERVISALRTSTREAPNVR